MTHILVRNLLRPYDVRLHQSVSDISALGFKMHKCQTFNKTERLLSAGQQSKQSTLLEWRQLLPWWHREQSIATLCWETWGKTMKLKLVAQCHSHVLLWSVNLTETINALIESKSKILDFYTFCLCRLSSRMNFGMTLLFSLSCLSMTC